MDLAALVALGTLVAKTVQQMVADGRTQTTAEEDAALAAAHSRADAADASYSQADQSKPS
jgi:hypothetical protein